MDRVRSKLCLGSSKLGLRAGHLIGLWGVGHFDVCSFECNITVDGCKERNLTLKYLGYRRGGQVCELASRKVMWLMRDHLFGFVVRLI